jgi:hypothetical protein
METIEQVIIAALELFTILAAASLFCSRKGDDRD